MQNEAISGPTLVPAKQRKTLMAAAAKKLTLAELPDIGKPQTADEWHKAMAKVMKWMQATSDAVKESDLAQQDKLELVMASDGMEKAEEVFSACLSGVNMVFREMADARQSVDGALRQKMNYLFADDQAKPQQRRNGKASGGSNGSTNNRSRDTSRRMRKAILEIHAANKEGIKLSELIGELGRQGFEPNSNSMNASIIPSMSKGSKKKPGEGWLESVGRGVYKITNKGQTALKNWAD